MTPPTNTRPLSVLIVDDDPDWTDTLAVLLRLHGHDPRTAADGEQAAAVLDGWRPDAAVLNVKSDDPGRFDLARRLRAAGEPPPLFVALIGLGALADVGLVTAGFDHHFLKPVDPDALLAVVTAHAGPRHGPD
jgi:DNA-binding response OmpR family regulator